MGILNLLFNALFGSKKSDSRKYAEYERYHRIKDGFCDNMNYQLYQCKAVYIQTKRRRTVKIEAFNEGEVKEKLSQDGYCEPYEIERIPFPSPTDAQIDNIKKYVTRRIPDDICLHDASAIIDASYSHDSIPNPDLLQYATEMKIRLSYYVGKKALYDVIFNTLETKDKIAFFVFCVYRYTTDDRQANLNNSPHKDLFYNFAENNMSDSQFIKSMNKYEGKDLRFFGKLTTGNGIEVTGGSTNTIAYKKVVEFLKGYFTLTNITSKKI